MNKDEIKQILMSMRTADNEDTVNNLLGKIDLLSEKKLSTMVSQIGDNEENIRKYLQQKLDAMPNNNNVHTPINEMFTYGVSGNSIHLHMPVDLHQMISEHGVSKTINTVNLQLLDAIEKIRRLQNEGFHKFNGKDSIYMISPILVGRELQFLNGLDFQTHLYKSQELQNDEFVSTHPEAQLATHIFGKEKNVGTAVIGMDKINSPEWQAKRIAQIKAFAEKGIILNSDESRINT